MNSKNKKIDNLISRVLKETLEDRTTELESKFNINELGGMHDAFGDLTPKQMEKIGELDNDALRKWIKMKMDKKGKGFDDVDDEEEYIEDEDEFEDNKKYVLKKDKDEEVDEGTIYEIEMGEGFDSPEIKRARHSKDYSEREFEELPIGYGEFDNKLQDDQTGISLRRHFKNRKRGEDNDDDEGGELVAGEMEFTEGDGETCEQCGIGSMNEGECSECGYMKESYDINNDNQFDYTEEENFDFEDESDHSSYKDPKEQERWCKSLSRKEAEARNSCSKYLDDEEFGEMTEKLHGNQRKLDKNKNGRLDSVDFKMLRAMKGKKEETKEGKKFPDLSGDGKITRKDILMGRGVLDKKGKKVETKESTCKVCGMKNCKCKHKNKSKLKESVQLTESQLIDLIEDVIIEQKLKYQSKSGNPKGLQKYKQSHEKSGKENKDYLKSVTKKMKDYLKDGSKGDFDMEPKMFPKGNGELAKMKKKAYIPSDSVKDFTDNLTAAGLENLDYDEIHPNEDWVDKNVEGSSMTGNNPEWANAVDTGINKKRNKIRKDNMLAKIKRKAYNKAPQPVLSDKSGDDSGSKLMMKLESENPKKSEQLNEEFDRMKDLIGYNRKTQ